MTQEITERARNGREKLTSALQDGARCLRFLLIHSALCMAFALTFGFVEMQVYMTTHSGNEFVGMYLVVALFILGPIACGLASPVYLWVYFKTAEAKRHRTAIAASFAASVGVWFVFHLLSAG